MGFITRCPACGTTFRVVPDQLKISDGWVRCGHCADVFDATLYLDTLVVDPAPAVRAPVPEPVLADGSDDRTPMLQDEVADRLVGPESEPEHPAVEATFAPPKRERGHEDDDWLVAPADLAAQETQDLQVLGPADADRWVAESTQPPAEMHDVSPRDDRVDPGAAAEVDAEFQAELHRFAASAQTSAHATNTPDAAEPAPSLNSPFASEDTTLLDAGSLTETTLSEKSIEPGFVRQARRRAFWQTPAMRVLMSVGVMLLVLLLALQAAVHERDRLAAARPAWQPALSHLCAYLGCEVEALRQIDSVVIDSSALVRRLGDFYAFDFVLKNTAGTAVAMPALELSLTDTRDQVLARRVFLPADLPGAPTSLPANGSLSVSLHLSLANGESLAMTGYRALVFYP